MMSEVWKGKQMAEDLLKGQKVGRVYASTGRFQVVQQASRLLLVLPCPHGVLSDDYCEAFN